MSTMRAGLGALLVVLASGQFLCAMPGANGRSRVRLPLWFEENRGQADPGLRFVARGPGYVMGFRAAGSALETGGARRLEIRLVGAKPDAPARGELAAPGTINYFRGPESRWVTGVPAFGRIRFEQVYPGIDVIYYWREGDLEYDFEVSPGADPGLIRLHAEGADELRIDARGDLVLRSGKHQTRHHSPRLFQRTPEGVREVAGRFRLDGAGDVRFEIGHYDRTAALIVDPVLTYSSFLGGALDDRAYAMAVDSSGYIYLAGETGSTNIPNSSPYQGALKGTSDAFIAKLNPAGTSLVYATYFGGTDRDGARGIAVDSSGAVYITGYTRSTDFPTTSGAYKRTNNGGEDVFIAKMAPSGGSLAYSTYLGGTSNEQARAIVVDSSGRAYVTGYTLSVNFPCVQAVQSVYGGSTDAFAARLNAAGTALEFSTYLGGSGNDTGNAIAVDSSGAAHIVGQTQSSNFPARNALQAQKAFDADGFIVKLTAAGSAFAYSTFLGGGSVDEIKAIALDSSGSVYVAGRSYSKTLPVTSGAYQSALKGDQDAFVAKVNTAGSALVYCTYLGGSGLDDASAIAVYGGEAYVVGDTVSVDFPVSGAGQSSFAGTRDAFLAVIGSSGTSLKGATYLGGSRDDYGRAVAVLNGQVYMAGYTFSSDFPVTSGGYSRSLAGSAEMFLAMQGAPAVITSPAAGSTLDSASVTFTWSSAAGAAAYRLDVGSTAGGTDLYSATLGLATSQSVTVPVDGRTLYVRLWTQMNSWVHSDYTYTAKLPAVKAVMQSPAAGSTLGTSATFTWSAGQSVTEYWLYVGHSAGAGDIYSVSQGTALSRTVTIPADNSTIYVRLSSKMAGAWSYNDYTYKSSQAVAAKIKAAMTSPGSGSRVGSTITFSWTNGTATQVWLYISKMAGGNELYDKNQGTATTCTVTGMPADSGTLYVRLWSVLSGEWVFNDYTYQTGGGGTVDIGSGVGGGGGTVTVPALVSPTPGTSISSSSVTFSWSTGTGVTGYWLTIGALQGSGGYFNSDMGTATSANVSGLIINNKIWVRLWWQVNGTWSYQDYSYN